MQDNNQLTSVKPGIYKHYKGQLYEVLLTATHSETLEQMVVYKQMYGGNGVWVRPAAMFLESIQYEGQTKKRFQEQH